MLTLCSSHHQVLLNITGIGYILSEAFSSGLFSSFFEDADNHELIRSKLTNTPPIRLFPSIRVRLSISYISFIYVFFSFSRRRRSCKIQSWIYIPFRSRWVTFNHVLQINHHKYIYSTPCKQDIVHASYLCAYWIRPILSVAFSLFPFPPILHSVFFFISDLYQMNHWWTRRGTVSWWICAQREIGRTINTDLVFFIQWSQMKLFTNMNVGRSPSVSSQRAAANLHQCRLTLSSKTEDSMIFLASHLILPV